MKKIIIAALIPLMLTACGSSEITDTVYVSSMGFSRSDGMYSVTVFGETVNSDGDIERISSSGRGADPAAAIENAGENCGKSIFYGHCSAMALDLAAVTDKDFYHCFTDSVISPACMIYYSDSPEEDAENIPARGFSEKLFRAASECLAEKPVTLPCARDAYKAAVIDQSGAEVLDRDDSYGLMLISGKEYPTVLTVKNDGGTFTAVKIAPRISRKGKISDGRTVLEITVRLKDSGSPADLAAAEKYITETGTSAFGKTVLAGTDAPGAARLAGAESGVLRDPVLIIKFR